MPVDGAAFFRVEGMAQPVVAELEGIRLLVPWCALSGDRRRLHVRVVYRNVGNAPVAAFGLMGAEDYVLSLDGPAGSERVLAGAVPPGLSMVVPAAGLAPGHSVGGGLLFELPEQGDAAAVASLSLRVTRFSGLRWNLDPKGAFVPPPAGRLLPVGQVLRSGIEAMSLVTLEVESVMVTAEGSLVVGLALRNAGRVDLSASTQLTGWDARLADGELNALAPDAVSPALETGITPASGILKAGTPHNGTVRFALAHPVAALQWQFFFPGFQRMTAHWNAQAGRFDTQLLDPLPEGPVAGSGREGAAGTSLAAEERRFRGIAELLERLNALIAAGDVRGYLSNLPPPLRESHGRLLRDRSRVGVRDFSLVLPPLQRFQVAADGKVQDVQVLARYRLADGAQDNHLAASATASFAPRDDASAPGNQQQWRIDDFRFVKAAPFWLLGYLQKRQTEHFTIFHRQGAASADRIDTAERQLEKSFRQLQRKGFPVQNGNLAVFLDKAEDFATVTGVAADRFDGAALLQYDLNKDGYEVGNRLIYINDARFFTGQRLWGMQDRQATLTHELVHLFLSRDARPWTPSWVSEGIAVHFAGQYNSWSRRALRQNPHFETLTLAELSTRHSLMREHDDAHRAQASYLLSGEAFARLARRRKEQTLLEFFRSYAAYNAASLRTALAISGTAPHGDSTHPGIEHAGPVITDILLQQHFGIGLAALDQEVKAFVRKRGF